MDRARRPACRPSRSTTSHQGGGPRAATSPCHGSTRRRSPSAAERFWLEGSTEPMAPFASQQVFCILLFLPLCLFFFSFLFFFVFVFYFYIFFLLCYIL